MVDVYLLKLDDNRNESCFQYLIDKVDEKKRQRVLTFRNKRDSYHTLFGDFLARYTIGKRLGSINTNVVFSYSLYGKPYAEGLGNVHFNIAHSGEYIVCAISNREVGIDIEQQIPGPFRDVADLFSIEEKQILYSQPLHLQQEFFYSLWTLKESYIKQTEEGLSRSLNSFSIKLTGDNISLEIGEKTLSNLSFKQYDVDVNYKMAVCAEIDNFSSLIPLSLSDIASVF
jgi:4'-phosphopantetheinyl transferase